MNVPGPNSAATEALVTVSILNYQRPEVLARVLESVVRQDYPDLQVVVVDNGSPEGAMSQSSRRFPQVEFIELGENMGTAARNHGLRAARGRIVVTLDNDVYFDHPLAIQEIVRAFERHPRAGCVVFRIYHPGSGELHWRDWWHSRQWQASEHEEFETHFISEGAAAFRREVFDAIEAYWAPFFITHEGLDLSLRLLNAGWEIWYVPSVKVWHIYSAEARQGGRSFYFNTRNLLPVVYRNFPWAHGLAYLLPRLAALGLYSLKAGFFSRFVRGLLDGLKLIGSASGTRRPLHRRTLRKLRALKKPQANLLARFRRHWHEVEF